MSAPAISVRGLSKAYRIGVAEDVPDTLVGAVKGAFTKPWQNFQRLRSLDTSAVETQSEKEDTVWALRDVSFDIQRGDVVGIIGRNGAGKSTLLKILSRITEPTSGYAEIRGRISSLLEVGTGFHPDLTGRENIYMNGTILGMTKREIDRCFDEIVDFSGVERFLDTPCKRYSSGMQVRLAFAVAAHLEPEILIVDEVLAVGDTEFQRKCLGKMNDVSASGRTVVFVSHNMSLMRGLCQKGMLLSRGELQFAGDFTETADFYADSVSSRSSSQNNLANLDSHVGRRKTSDPATIRNISMNGSMSSRCEVVCGEPLQVQLAIHDPKARENTCAAVFLCQGGVRLSMLHSIVGNGVRFGGREQYEISCKVDSLPFVPGLYTIDVALGTMDEVVDYIEDVATIMIEPGDPFGTGKTPTSSQGMFLVHAKWQQLSAEANDE